MTEVSYQEWQDVWKLAEAMEDSDEVQQEYAILLTNMEVPIG